MDGREKAPYTFQGLVSDAKDGRRPLVISWEYAYLQTGDYTIAGHEGEVAIERKSLEDIYVTLGQHRERFEREHVRLAKMGFAAVVIEASWHWILTQPPERSQLRPKVVFRTAISWMVRYRVPWLTMQTRRLAEITTFRLLEKWWNGRERNDAFKNINS